MGRMGHTGVLAGSPKGASYALVALSVVVQKQRIIELGVPLRNVVSEGLEQDLV